jgi:hypothetical protein
VLQRLAPTLWRLRDVDFDVPPSYTFGDRPTVTVTPAATSGVGVNMTAGAAYWVNADVGRTIEVTAGPSLGAEALITSFTSSTVVVATIVEPFADTSAVAVGNWYISDSPMASVTPSAKEPVGLTGVTLTASIAAWRTTDVGKFVLLNDGCFEITGFTSSTVVTATIRGTANGTTASPADAWTLDEAAFSALNGYPAAVAFFDDRLGFAGTRAQPNTRWLSKTGDYGNFAGGALDDDAVVNTLTGSQVNAIRWLSGRKVLITGTVGGEFVLRLQDGTTITPGTLGDKPETDYGSAKDLAPITAGASLLFPTRSQRKLRELVYSFEVDRYVAPDLLTLAKHLTRAIRISRQRVGRRIVDLAYQREPDSVIWAVREDGALLSCTYLRDQNVVAWARHITGDAPQSDRDGFAYPAAGDGIVESVAVIQHPDGDREQVWLSVRRIVNNQSLRYVEVLDDAGLYYDQLNTDCSLTFDGLATVDVTPSAVSGSVTFTATGPVFAATDVGAEVRNLVGAGRATITGYTSPTQVVGDVTIPFLTTAQLPAGTWGRAVPAILSGLSHLEGRTVEVVGDGARYEPVTVVGGAITLSPAYPAVQIEVGLGYTSTLTTQRPELDGAPTLQGSEQRHAEITVRFYETLGGRVNGQELAFRTAADALGAPPPLFSGDMEVSDLAGDAAEVITIEQRDPLPQTVLLITSTLVAADQ